MRHRLYAHIVWTTRARARLIDARRARFLDRFLPAVAREERALILEMGMVQTHIHLLVRVHPMTNLPRLLQRLKGASSAVADREHRSPTGESLRWAKGYTIQSVSRSALPQVRTYVQGQPSRHPSEAIPGWLGALSATGSAEEEWLGEDRRTNRASPRRRG